MRALRLPRLRTKSITASPFQWRPIFDEPLELAHIATDVRPVAEQYRDYSTRAQTLDANETERNGIVESLQLCERSYGYAAVNGAWGLVEAILLAAKHGLSCSLSALSARQGAPDIGAFIGWQIEVTLTIPTSRRRFPHSRAPWRAGSPHLDFEDIRRGCLVRSSLAPMSLCDVKSSLAYAALIHRVRTTCGERSAAKLERDASLFAQMLTSGPAREQAFAKAVSQSLSQRCIQPPMAWREHCSRHEQEAT